VEGFVLSAVSDSSGISYLDVMRKSKTNFFYSSVFLERERREGLRIIYAFCRMTDDIADNSEITIEDKRINLLNWEQKLKDSLYSGYKEPFFDLLKQNIEQFSIPHKPLFDLIKGMRMDLDKHEYGTFEELYEYCYCAASSVGLMSIEIFGHSSKETEKFAEYLGIALQLTNIIRDVKKDFNSGRIYIPSEDMEKFGYSAEDLKIYNYNNSFRNLMKYECERAREYYSLAWKFLPAEDRKNMTAALIMERIYYLLLQKIEKRKYNIFGDPVRISSLRKFIAASSVFMKHKIF
jgi:15-cis-phytoene synthase